MPGQGQPGGLFGPSPALMAQDNFLNMPAAKLTPQDKWLQLQLETLQKYFAIAQRHQMMKKQQGKKDQQQPGDSSSSAAAVADPIMDEMLMCAGLPANIGPDPHTLGSKQHLMLANS